MPAPSPQYAEIQSRRRALEAMVARRAELSGSAAVTNEAAIKAATGDLNKLIDEFDALNRRQIDPTDDNVDYGRGRSTTPRQAGPDWGDAVIKSIADRGERMGGTKSFLSAGDATVATTVGGPVEDPRRARFLSELMPAENAEGGHLAYLKQTVRDNKAAVVAPGGVKPTSIYTLTRVDDTTDVIAHLTEPINRQDLDDASVLRQFINQELNLGLELAIDVEIIDAIALAGPIVEGDIGTTLDTTRRALTRLQEREVEPSAFVFCPRDWEQIELEAQAAFAANANMAAPTDAVRRSLYGIPVFLTNGVAQNTGYLGDFRTSAVLYRTGGVQIDWSEGHYDSGTGATDFERNLVRFRAETRIKPAILRPFAFCEINLAGTGS
jgi:HK97 family phage major capsid protein